MNREIGKEVYRPWEPKMYTAGQRILLTIIGPGPSFFYTKIYAGQQTRRGQCPIEHGENFHPPVGGWGRGRGAGRLGMRHGGLGA